MTWLADVTQNRPSEAEALTLKAKREDLVKKLKVMQQSTGMQRSQAGRDGHAEDMRKVAAQVTAIDRKLGRV